MVFHAGDDDAGEDRRLLQAWLGERDEAALAALLARHRPTLLGTVRRIVHDDQAAEDAVQETCIRLCDHADTITGSIGAWLHQTARNLALSHIRSQARRRRREAEAGAESVRLDQPAAEADGHLRALVVDCVNALTPAERDLIVRVFWDGRSQREMASEQRVSQVAIHKRVHAALGRLRQQLSRRGCTTTAAALAALLAAMAGGSSEAAESTWLTQAPPAGSGWLVGAGTAGIGFGLAGWLTWGMLAAPGANRHHHDGPGIVPAGEPALAAVPRRPGPAATSPTAATMAGTASNPSPDGRIPALAESAPGWTACPGRDWGFWLLASPVGPERLQPDDAAGMVMIRDLDGAETITLRPPAHATMVIAIPLRHDPAGGVVAALEVGLPANPAVRDRRLVVLAGATTRTPSLLYWASLAGDDPVAVPPGLAAPALRVLGDPDTKGYALTIGDSGIRTHGLAPFGILRNAFPAREMGSQAIPLQVPGEGLVLGRVRTRAMGAAELATLQGALPPPPVREQ